MEAELSHAISDGPITVRVMPGAGATKVVSNEQGVFRIQLKARPEKGEANLELVKFLSKLVKKKVKIVSGLTSRTKIVRIAE